MSRAQTKQSLKLHLLALVLALALVWYSLNPVLTTIIRRKQEPEPPDEKKRNVEPHHMPGTLSVGFRPIRARADRLSAPDEDEDDFEWPEFIDG